MTYTVDQHNKHHAGKGPGGGQYVAKRFAEPQPLDFHVDEVEVEPSTVLEFDGFEVDRTGGDQYLIYENSTLVASFTYMGDPEDHLELEEQASAAIQTEMEARSDRLADATANLETPGVAGYTYKAENYTPKQLLDVMVEEGRISYRAAYNMGLTVDECLTRYAELISTNRDDEHSFDSDEFPKVIPVDGLTHDDLEWLER